MKPRAAPLRPARRGVAGARHAAGACGRGAAARLRRCVRAPRPDARRGDASVASRRHAASHVAPADRCDGGGSARVGAPLRSPRPRRSSPRAGVARRARCGSQRQRWTLVRHDAHGVRRAGRRRAAHRVATCRRSPRRRRSTGQPRLDRADRRRLVAGAPAARRRTDGAAARSRPRGAVRVSTGGRQPSRSRPARCDGARSAAGPPRRASTSSASPTRCISALDRRVRRAARADGRHADGRLEKATITNTVTGRRIAVLFNPEEYTLNARQQLRPGRDPGLVRRSSSSSTATADARDGAVPRHLRGAPSGRTVARRRRARADAQITDLMDIDPRRTRRRCCCSPGAR